MDALPFKQVLQWQAGMLERPTLDEALARLVADLAAQLGCRRAAVGLSEPAGVRLVALSDLAHGPFDGHRHDDLRAAMDEAAAQRAPLACPAAWQDAPRITAAHERLLSDGDRAVASFPFPAEGPLVGVVTLHWRREDDVRAVDAPRLVHQLSLVAPVIGLLVQAGRSPWARWREQSRRRWQAMPAARRASVGLAAIAAIAVLAWPVSYDVSGRARVEGAVERAVSAPADGFIQAVLVRPGDTVSEGAPLLELASQDLRAETQRLSAEVAEHESAYLAALGDGDHAAMAVQLARMQEARSQLALASARLGRARVTAPMDGVVLEGDLTRSVGAPVRRGDMLLTLAPRGRFRVVAQISERDIAAIRVGQPVQLALAALSWQTLQARVIQVLPVARAEDGDNVFEVETALAVPPDGLRPGMTGVARIAQPARPLAFTLGRRLVDALRLRWWRWLP